MRDSAQGFTQAALERKMAALRGKLQKRSEECDSLASRLEERTHQCAAEPANTLPRADSRLLIHAPGHTPNL